MTASRGVSERSRAEVLHMIDTICYKFQSDSDPKVPAQSGRGFAAVSACMKWYVCVLGVLVQTLHFLPGATAAPYGLDTRAPIGPFLNDHLPRTLTERSSDWAAVRAFPNLTFPDPLGLLPGPVTNRLYVHCRQRQIYFFTNDPAVSTKTIFLDISARTQGWADCG